MARPELDRRLAALASLGDPLRRDLYHCVTGREGGVGRDEAAATVGVSRSLAAYHLDKLVDDGLLEPHYQRRSGRRGPGAGRPAKHYVRAARNGLRPFAIRFLWRKYRLSWLLSITICGFVTVQSGVSVAYGWERNGRSDRGPRWPARSRARPTTDCWRASPPWRRRAPGCGPNSPRHGAGTIRQPWGAARQRRRRRHRRVPRRGDRPGSRPTLGGWRGPGTGPGTPAPRCPVAAGGSRTGSGSMPRRRVAGAARG